MSATTLAPPLRESLAWDRAPRWSDPRIPFAFILVVYTVLGITVLGFNRAPAQILITVAAACALDMALHFMFRGRRLLFPLSAVISGLGLSILMNYAHGLWLPLVPIFLAIGSKYVVTCNGRHVFNPTLFAVVACLRFGEGMFSEAPAYQWGGSVAMAAFVVTAALALFVFRIQRYALILSFLGFYFLQLTLRAYLTRHHVPPETLFLGALSSAWFYLFAFFMITDPQTSPSSRRGQIWMAFSIVLVDLVFHRFMALSTLFYAAFTCSAARLLWLHWKAWSEPGLYVRFGGWLRRAATLAAVFLCGWAAYAYAGGRRDSVAPDFFLREIDLAHSGLGAGRSDILERVDPRIANVAKWVLSAGDAVAVADFDGDGLQDLFLTYSLKDAAHRAALYRNIGSMRFERVPVPALEEMARSPETRGLPSGALWFDYDNDGDPDLLVLAGYGKPLLLRNDGSLHFTDVTNETGIDEYTISLGANALDFNRDGKLDLILCNAFSTTLPGYSRPTPFNVFRLPAPEYSGDRRMFDFMHRTWHNANNGGGCMYFENRGGRFVKRDIGLADLRWSLAVGAGDLNNDGYTDLYIANDFGPDQLYLNDRGQRLRPVAGALVGSLGRDTYKGMNASIGDLDNNGFQDVYVSNVHERLQAEGSLLWMNNGRLDSDGHLAMSDEAMARNALNERRFGWGGAMGDLDRDGRLDLLQVNGHIDNSYDPIYPGCPDYWYWNDKIALTSPDNHGHSDRWADLRGRCIFAAEKNRVYLNRGRYFVDVAEQVGFARPGTYRGVALADFENQGKLDVVVASMYAPASLYRNEPKAAAWIGFDLYGDGQRCNTDALGTKVTIETSAGRQIREVQALNGFSAQGDRRLLFGIGTHHGSVSTRIEWCGGIVVEEKILSPSSYHAMRLPAAGR